MAPAPGRLQLRDEAAPALLAGSVSLVLGSTHLLPGVALWDPGEFQTIGPALGTAHPTGYPAFVLLGWLASVVLQAFGDPAFRINLLSTLLVAGTALVVTLLGIRLSGRPIIALAGGLAVAAAPVAWYLGTHADPHSLHGLLVALVVLLLVVWGERRRAGSEHASRWLFAASVAYGISLANHELTLLVAPGIALYVLATYPRIVLRPRLLLVCAGLVAGTAGVLYLQLPLSALLGAPLVYGHPATWSGFWYVVLAEQFHGLVLDPLVDPGGTVSTSVDALAVQLGPLLALVPFAAIATAIRRPRYALLTFPTFVLTVWFAAIYPNAEIERYYLGPTLIAVTWLVVGAGWLADVVGARVRRTAPAGGLVTMAAAVPVALSIALVAPAAAALPERDARVAQVGSLDARTWLDRVFAELGPNATVVSWWSYSTPLWYGTIIEGRRRDVRVVDDRTRLDEGLGSVPDVVRANLGRGPVYLIREPEDMAALEQQFVLEPVPVPGDQPVYRVLGPRAPGS